MGMDAEFQGVLWTFGIDVMFLLVCYFLYLRMLRPTSKTAQYHVGGASDASAEAEAESLIGTRPRSRSNERSKLIAKYDEARRASANNNSDSEAMMHPDAPLSGIMQRLFSPMPVKNDAAFLYLRFMQLLILAVSIMTGVLCFTLIPIYIAGANRVSHPTWLQVMSAGNVPTGQNAKLLTVFCCVLLCSALTYAVLWYYLCTVQVVAAKSMRMEVQGRSSRERAIESHALHTVHMTGLDATVTDEAALMAHFEHVLPGQVRFVYIALDMDSFSWAVAERKKAKEAITKFTILEERRGQELYVGATCGMGGERAVEYYETRKVEMSKLIQNEKKKKRPGSGHAFLVFSHLPDLQILQQTGAQQSDAFPNAKNWSFSVAPHPSDIKWNNLMVSGSSRWLKSVAVTVGLVVLMIAIITPVSIIELLTPLVDSVKDSIATNPTNPARVLITQFTPPLVLFLINVGILPTLIDRAAQSERHLLYSDEEKSIFTKNFFFLVLNVILIPTLALNSLSAFVTLTYTTSLPRWSQTVGRAFLSSSGHFAIQYVMNAGFLGAAAQLLDIPQRIGRVFSLYFAITPLEVKQAKQRLVWEFGYWYAVRGTMFGLILFYSTIVPLILPVGLLYFALVYLADKNNFRNQVYRFKWETNGRLEGNVTRYLLFSVGLYQFAMAGFFLVQESGHHYYPLSVCLSLMSLISFWLYFSKYLRYDASDHAFSAAADASAAAAAASGTATLTVTDADGNEVRAEEADRDHIHVIVLRNEIHGDHVVEDDDANVLDSPDLSDQDEIDHMPLWQVYTHPLSRSGKKSLSGPDSPAFARFAAGRAGSDPDSGSASEHYPAVSGDLEDW